MTLEQMYRACGGGFAAGKLTLPNGDFWDGVPSGSGGWTQVGRWDSDAGDIPAIVTAFNGFPRGQGIAWSPDGNTLTLCSTSDDSICSFNCTTPWDPSTAVLITRRPVTNPQGLCFNIGGSQLITRVIVGDRWDNIPAAGHVVGLGAVTSDITKADIGAGGPTDGFMSFSGDLGHSNSEQRGPVGTNTQRGINFSPNGDLDGFSLLTAVASPVGINIALTQMIPDLTQYYRCLGAQGFQIVNRPNAPEATGVGVSAIDNTGLGGFRPNHAWIDVNDTSSVWCVWDTAGVRIAHFATNI